MEGMCQNPPLWGGIFLFVKKPVAMLVKPRQSFRQDFCLALTVDCRQKVIPPQIARNPFSGQVTLKAQFLFRVGIVFFPLVGTICVIWRFRQFN